MDWWNLTGKGNDRGQFKRLIRPEGKTKTKNKTKKIWLGDQIVRQNTKISSRKEQKVVKFVQRSWTPISVLFCL